MSQMAVSCLEAANFESIAVENFVVVRLIK